MSPAPGVARAGGGTPLSCWGLVRGQHRRQPRTECVPEACKQSPRNDRAHAGSILQRHLGRAPSALGDKRREPLPPTTHLVTTAILTPKTPVCFREGILFKLNSLLVNLIDSFTSICRGGRGARPSASWSSEPAPRAP